MQQYVKEEEALSVQPQLAQQQSCELQSQGEGEDVGDEDDGCLSDSDSRDANTGSQFAGSDESSSPWKKRSNKIKKKQKCKSFVPGTSSSQIQLGSSYRMMSSGSLLEDVLNEKKMTLMQSPQVLSFLQNLQEDVRCKSSRLLKGTAKKKHNRVPVNSQTEHNRVPVHSQTEHNRVPVYSQSEHTMMPVHPQTSSLQVCGDSFTGSSQLSQTRSLADIMQERHTTQDNIVLLHSDQHSLPPAIQRTPSQSEVSTGSQFNLLPFSGYIADDKTIQGEHISSQVYHNKPGEEMHIKDNLRPAQGSQVKEVIKLELLSTNQSGSQNWQVIRDNKPSGEGWQGMSSVSEKPRSETGRVIWSKSESAFTSVSNSADNNSL